MAHNYGDAEKMLDICIYDYLLKKNLYVVAESFMIGRGIPVAPRDVDVHAEFLREWWSFFWDMYTERAKNNHSSAKAAYLDVVQKLGAKVLEQEQKITAKDLQQLRMRQIQLNQSTQLPLRNLDNSLLGFNSEGTTGKTSAMAEKMYTGRMRDLDQGKTSAMIAKMYAERMRDLNQMDSAANITQTSLPAYPSSIYWPGIMQSNPRVVNAGHDSGVDGLQLKGWPLTGLDQSRASLNAQVQTPFLHRANQFQLLPQQQKQLLSQVQAQGYLSTSSNFDMDRNNFNAKDGQSIAMDGAIGSPTESSSSTNDRKKKVTASSRAFNSTGTKKILCLPPNSQPSTPSAHTTGGVAMAANLQNVSDLASSTKNLDEMELLEDIDSLDAKGKSLLSLDDNDGRDLSGTLTKVPAADAVERSKGFSFNEVACMRDSNSKIICCHFSSDGKLLASAGHAKKVVLWKIETFQTKSTSEHHSQRITDVRFIPNSTLLATSSFDTTVRLWNVAHPNDCLKTYCGHNSHVMSLDFHPTKNGLFCSCDANNEIRIWDIHQNYSIRVLNGGSTNVRFQPRIGHFLAAASDNLVSIFNAETYQATQSLKGHSTEVLSVCWDSNGDRLASVSGESVRIWSSTSGECIHEFISSRNTFSSCVFHPNCPSLLLIGGYQCLEFWNMAENKCMTFPAHEDMISCLAHSPVTGMIASASHNSVKIWK